MILGPAKYAADSTAPPYELDDGRKASCGYLPQYIVHMGYAIALI